MYFIIISHLPQFEQVRRLFKLTKITQNQLKKSMGQICLNNSADLNQDAPIGAV